MLLVMAGWDDDKPWTAPAHSLVLYCPKGQWRYAIFSAAGIVDGVLSDLAPNTPPTDAQAFLLDRVGADTGLRYMAVWKQDQDRWWSAQLTTLMDDPGTH